VKGGDTLSEASLAGKEVIVLGKAEAKRVGSGIRELRQRRGLSLEECARRANVSDDYLVRLEQGHELKVDRAILDTLRQAGGIDETR
jgi:ribosome-binding protein aMBF1 (putative translation factor)